jgi:hypothetical protein
MTLGKRLIELVDICIMRKFRGQRCLGQVHVEQNLFLNSNSTSSIEDNVTCNSTNPPTKQQNVNSKDKK